MLSVDDLLSQLMGQAATAGSGVNGSAGGVPISVPLEALLGGGPPFGPSSRRRDGNNGGSGGSGPSRGGGGPSPLGSASSAVGSVFRGDMPPALWVQREQQRTAAPYVANRNVAPPVVSFEAQEAERLRLQGNTAFQAGQYKEAIELYSHSIRSDPSSAFAYCNRSFAHLKMGNVVEAVADAEEAVNLQPNSYKAYYRLGMALIARGGYRRALDSLRRASALAVEDAEKETIKVALAKCESRLARNPDTRLLSETSSTTCGQSDDGPRMYDGPLDFTDLLSRAKKAIDTRCELQKYRTAYDNQKDIVECRSHLQRVQELLKIATTTPLAELVAQANEKQTALRRMLKSDQRQTYNPVKKDRDESYQQLWNAADELERSIKELRRIAADEESFFQRFGLMCVDTCRVQEVGSVEELQDHTAMIDGVDEQSEESLQQHQERLEQIIQRRLEIEEEVRKTQQRLAITEEAGREFFSALLNEERLVERLKPVLEEAGRLNAEMERRARFIAHTTTAELSPERMTELERLAQEVAAVQESHRRFSRTLEEGNELLEQEAELERERLRLERQRIQIQGEIEWLKVCDEPSNKINQLENTVQQLHKRLEDLQVTQKRIQKGILELIDGEHPELAWTSMLSGSRILRLVKGSGLWLNISLTDIQILGEISSSEHVKVHRAMFRGETVAVKVISLETEASRNRFRTEVSVVARCHHPNVIAIKGVFFEGGHAYILLPYFPRGSLKNLIDRKETMPWSEIQDIFRQVVSGVAYLHEQGIVHANIRPSKVFLAESNRPVIADFGIAVPGHGAMSEIDASASVGGLNSGEKHHEKEMLNEGGGQTTTSSTSLSLAEPERLHGQQYLAPELMDAPQQRPSCASDVWALGRTLFDVAAYHAYFLDSSLGVPSIPTLIPSQTRIEIPPKRVSDDQLADLISSTLMADPHRRPSAYELLAHPYFSVSLNMHQFNRSTALLNSDGRIEAVRSYIHAIRREHGKVLVSVQRPQMVESVAAIFPNFDEKEMISPIMVVFQGEAGIDEGALTTEMLNLYYEQLIANHHALVSADTEEHRFGSPASSAAPAAGGSSVLSATRGDLTEGQNASVLTGVTYLPAADDAQIPEATFELLGKVMLKNIVENRSLPVELNASVLKFFCGASVTILDLEEYDRTLARNLKQLRLLSAEDLASAYLDFSSFSEDYLEKQCNGLYTQSTAVQASNVRDYVRLSVEYFLIYKRRKALEAMKKGFYHYASLSSHLKLLSPFDLQILLSGMQHINVQVITDALEFKDFPASSKTPTYLKEILSKMTQNNLRRFLQLCTSTAATPINGAMKKITVVCCADVQRLPVGHGCVYQLDLPDYNNAKVLEEKLLVALAHVSDGFHIV